MQGPYISESDEYRTLTSLGHGSKGKVFLVTGKNGKNYAMKVGDDEELMHKESELLKKLKHPCFPEWRDYMEDGKGKLIMEYIEGITLQRYMEQVGIPERRITEYIMTKLLDGLAYLHTMTPPVIFRDLKPENIMITKGGSVRIIDLGSAASDGYKVGSPGYAAPEQFWEGTHPEIQWDIYAAGKVLAYLLTGKNPCEPPFDMLSFCERNRCISPAMNRVIQRSLAYQSMGRYASAREFKEEMKTAFAFDDAKKWNIFTKKEQIVYEKCVWKSGFQRIF